MRDVAPVVLGGIGVMPCTALGSIHADPVDPMPGHEAAALLRELPEEAVETLLAYTGPEADCPSRSLRCGSWAGRWPRSRRTPRRSAIATRRSR